jgi:hypothetical protein
MQDMISMGYGARSENEPLGAELNEAEQSDMEMYEAMAPKGDFTSRGLNPLVKATNKMLPLFDQEPSYPLLEATNVLPTDFVRILAMFTGAVDDAIAKEAVSPEMGLDFGEVRDDTGLLSLAGKIDMLSKDKSFKSFLKEPQEEVEEEAEAEDELPMSSEEEDELLMSRM